MRLFTCIHGRHDITKAFFMHLEYLREATGLDLPISVCYSEIEDLENIKEHIREQDSAVCYSNLYLGDKWNYLVSNMIKMDASNRYMSIGSDDFMSVEFVNYMDKCDSQLAGVNSIYFYEMFTEKAVSYTYEHPFNVTFGAGRLYSHKVLSRIFNTGDLWQEKQQKGLDNQAEREIYNRLGIKPDLIEFDKPQIVDIKSFENLHSFDEYTSKGVKVEPEECLQLIPNVVFE